jgi:MFS family permease
VYPRIRDFRLLVTNRFLLTFGVQMMGVTVGWQVYQLTHDPLVLGLIGLAEAVTYIGSALLAGHAADRLEKRRIILSAQTVLLFSVLGLLLLSWRGNTRMGPVYAVFALTGIARAFLWSASSSYAEMIVPKEHYARAAAWTSSSWEIGSVLGPAAGGLLYGLAGPNASYLAAASVIVGALLVGSQLGEVRPQAVEDEGLFESLVTGVRFVFRHQVILGALALDMFAVLFGGVVAILPVFAELLRVGPMGLGLLRGAQSAGAITMALIQTRRPVFRHAGRSLLFVVALFGVAILGFAVSRSYVLSLALLAVAGMADNVSVVVRASILQASTPDRMRGRVAAVNGIFIGSSNELGAFESGLAARLLGATRSVILGGVMTLIAVATVGWRFPRLRKLREIAALATPAPERPPG